MGCEWSEPKQEVTMKQSLIDEVFSWSTDNILDEQLFKDQVEKIPENFLEVDGYFRSFVYPLLEETRAQLSSRIDTNIASAPYAQILTTNAQVGTDLYDVKVDYWRNRLGVNGKDPYKTLPGDVFVLTEAKPENLSDLRWLGKGWGAKIEGNSIGYDDEDAVTCLRVEAFKENQVHLLLHKKLFVVFLMNLRTRERIWKSLQMDGNYTLIKQILNPSVQKDRRYSCQRNCSGVEELIRTISSDQLNESQRKVIVDILCKLKCNQSSAVQLIQGLPGTGKTKTLSVLLYILLRMEYRTLICAPADTSIKEVVAHVLKLAKTLSSCSLGSIVYFRDNGVVQIEADTEYKYFNHHVKDLRDCLKTVSLVFCTASTSYMLHSVIEEPLNLLIIDGAAQLKECESFIPLQLPGVKHIVLFGDQGQLTENVTSNVSAKAGIGTSLFERLYLNGCPKHILNMQYRMHPLISSVINSVFYGSQVLDAPNVRTTHYDRHFLPDPMFGPFSFINVSCGNEEMDSLTCSYKNMAEVAIVIKIVQKLFKAWSTSKQKLSVGIVTFYTAQAVAIKEKVGMKYENLEGFSLKVNMVDDLAGSEEDIMILTTVRTNSGGLLGFISNLQRTNVALTRARYSLWIVGKETALSDSNAAWKSVVQEARDRKCFYEAEQDEELSDTVLQIKQELDQFDGVLNGDSLLFKNARWKVFFSENFKKSFEKLKSSEMRKLVLNLLLRLSCGWRPKRRSTKLICDNFSQMLKQFKVKNLYIICSNDVVKDSLYFQVLKVWDILPLEDIPKLITRLDSVFLSYTEAFISRCKTKCMEGDLEVPMSWNTEVTRYNSRTCDSVEKTFADSLLLVKFYSLSSNIVGHLVSGCDGNEMDFPFELTDEEMEIIRFSRSSFILARSGTGKTTVLIMKLFQKEQLHHLASEGFHEVERNSNKETDGYTLRQMFVTVNARLCYSVRQYISQLKRSTCKGTYSGENSNFMEEDFDEMLESSDIPSSFADLSQSSYPLVITFNKFLMMLDGTIGSSFFERFPELRRLRRDKRTACESMVLKTFIRTKEVNYEKFCSSYWPYFSPMNTKKLVPSSVFSEIISHIKGGSRIGINDDRISREDYIIYSERRLSFFSEEERGRIYDIFLEYEKKKKRNGEFDMSDLVADLHKRFRDETFEGEKIDFVYIDEVQDLTMRQISLFKYICRNFKEGFVFSGDTAQTIVRGVDFRFEDIRALFYREFLCERKEKGKIADLFYLSQNFRTHAGVLKLANSVLDLLYHFFPSSVDKLKPETSIVHGEQPVWVQTEDGLNGLRASFKSSGSVYKGFGAEQVILVRDEDNKNEVFNLVGKQALVLTVMECKGLEFQDVLLYNLFSSSPLNDEWDIVYGYMKGKGFLEFPHHLKSVPSFDEGKHIAMCSELKQLYVAITRTRRRLWILENGQCPVLQYWEKLQLVHIRGLDGGFLEEIQVASSQEEWKARGFKFFYQKNYDKARFCFERAGESYWEKWAKAACLRHSADLLLHSDPIRAHKHLTQAAKMYQSIGKIESAAQCFFELKEYEKAGKLYLENFGDSKLEEAGECFHLAACYERAADIYAKCNLYSKCLSVCADGKLFHLGYQYIENWKCSSFHLDTEVCQRFFEKGAVYLKKIKDSKSMMKFVKAFESEEVMRTFLMSKECLDELVSLEKEWGNFSEAANVANKKGDVLLEVDLLLMAKLYERACKLILVYVLYNSVWAQQSNGWPLNKFVLKDELLTKAKTFSKKVSNGFYDFVCTEANILSHEVYLFQINKYWDDSWKNGSIRGKMLCVRKFLDTYLSPSMSKQILEDDMIKFTQSKKSWEHTSVANLTFYCDFWLKETDKMLQNVEGDSKEDSRSEFCMNYFGVSKQLRNGCKTVYLLLYPDAAWVHDINPRHIKRNEYSSWIDADQFVSAVKRYWSSKLSTYGIQFLETLEALYKFSVDNALSLYCKTAILIHIFKVSKFLTKSKFVNHREYSDMLQKFLEISIRNFFDHIYLLDLENSITDDMLCFRESDTSRNFQRDVSRMITSRTMTSKETGILITALFSVKFPFSLYKQTLASFKACYTTSWKVFVENFRNIRSEVTGDSNDDTGELALVQKFHKALEDTDFADFSPSCYLFLLDRLLIMVSFLKGYFFTPKFLLVEWLISNGWNVNPNLNFVSGVQQPFLEDIVHFIAGMVEKLLYHEQDTIEWIRKHNLNMDCYPIIVLRLFVILCLLCINFDGFSDFIFNLLEKREITLLLPWKFYESLRRLREHGKTEVKIEVVAEALKNIGNPLVIVNLGIEFSVSDAIFLNLNVEQHRGSIMKALRPGLNRKQSRGRRIFSNINHQGELQTSSFDSVMERNAAETQSEEVSKGQRTNRRFWTMVGSLDYEGIHRNNFQIDVLPLKKIVLEFILLVTNSVIRWCCQCSWQDCEVPYEQFDSLLDELQQLYSTLCLSEFYFEDVKAIQNIVKKLQLRRERIEPFVERWLMCERKLEENTDPESHKNGGAEKCSSEVAVSCTTGQCSSDRSDKEGGDRSADEYSSEL